MNTKSNRLLETTWKRWFIGAIQYGFERFGLLIGRRPYIFIVVTLAVSIALTAGVYKMNVVIDIRYGYTPDDAPSHHEAAVRQEFFGNNNSHGTWFLIDAKDGGSILRKEHLNAIDRLRNYVLDFTVSTPHIANYSYAMTCESTCDNNLIFTRFKKGLEIQRARIAGNKPLSDDYILDFPKIEYLGYKVDISNTFYGCVVNESARNVTGTIVESCNLVIQGYQGMIKNESMKEALEKWELALFDYANNLNDTHIRILVFGENIANAEIMRAAFGATKTSVAGSILLLLFVFSSMSFSYYYYSTMTVFVPLLVFVALLSPVLSVMTTFGITCLFGVPVNPLMVSIPFLVIAIGVDDTFLMVHCWQRLSRTHGQDYSVPEKMAVTLREIGPSITITSITDSLAFAVGAFNPLPQIRSFCLIASIAMFMDCIYELTLFATVLALVGHHEKSAGQLKWPKFDTSFRKFVRNYSEFLTTWNSRILMVVILGLCWTMGILGIVRMKSSFRAEKSFPADSVLIEAAHLSAAQIYKNRHAIIFFVNNPPNITDLNEYGQFNQMMNELEKMNNSLGPEYSTLWMRDYEAWVESTKVGMDWLTYEDDSLLSYDDVPYFLESHQGKLLEWTVKWKRIGSKTAVQSFVFVTCYANSSDWIDRADQMMELRDLLSRYPQFNATLWERNSGYFDLSFVAKKLTFACIYITMACMLVVCMLFVPNISCVLVAISAIGSICFCTLGFLSWWNVDLDPLTMINMFPSIGFSVDYTAHIVYHYHRHSTEVSKPQRLMKTFNSVAIPMVQAALSTVITICLLGFTEIYVFTIFFKTIVFVISLGLLHGLFIVPTVLALLPDSLTGTQESPEGPEEHPLKVIE